MNGELPLADSGATVRFGRLGWNDGRTESFVFTEVDRHASAGGQISGSRWRRADDVFGAALVADELSALHRAYLAAGGKGFLLGDGALRYGSEDLVELYYSVAMGGHVAATPDAMSIVHPGYNRDRGPVQVYTICVRVVW